MATVDFPSELRELRTTLQSVLDVSDLEGLRTQIAELSEQAAAPDLWNDPEKAQGVTSRLSHLQAELERLERMSGRVDDLEVLVELAESEDDADTLQEAEQELRSVKKALGELEVRTLLSGEYDDREALVTIRAEAGGVDAADFAEMLLRMYLRWSERHNYSSEVYDTSYAEEAGIKSATFKVSAPYAYGTLSVEQGTHLGERAADAGVRAAPDQRLAGGGPVQDELAERAHQQVGDHADERVAEQQGGPGAVQPGGRAEEQPGADRPADRDHLHVPAAEGLLVADLLGVERVAAGVELRHVSPPGDGTCTSWSGAGER